MTEETKTIFEADKSAKIIKAICNLYGVNIEKAADIYFNSETSILIEEGVAQLHCRSEEYLAQCVWDEYNEQSPLS